MEAACGLGACGIAVAAWPPAWSRRPFRHPPVTSPPLDRGLPPVLCCGSIRVECNAFNSPQSLTCFAPPFVHHAGQAVKAAPPPPITLSDAALAQCLKLRAETGGEELLLRVGVKSGGCSGMSCKLSGICAACSHRLALMLQRHALPARLAGCLPNHSVLSHLLPAAYFPSPCPSAPPLLNLP